MGQLFTSLLIAVAFALVLWVFIVAPPLVDFALAVVTAIAWCIWIESRPETAAK
jgi:hypothetical protein